jgi:hypothetical protein
VTYEQYRPATIVIPRAEFQRRAAELLGELAHTQEGQMVYAVVRWARRQVEVERSG